MNKRKIKQQSLVSTENKRNEELQGQMAMTLCVAYYIDKSFRLLNGKDLFKVELNVLQTSNQ